MKLFYNCLLLFSAVAALTGCGSSLLSVYPNLPAHKLTMTSAALLADCVIIDDMIGDTNKIDVVMNKSFGGMILTYFTDKLTAKGYRIDNNILSSVGLLMDRQQVYKLVQSVRTKDTDLEELPAGVPPFYLNDIFQSDSAAANLWSTYDALVHSSPREGASTTFVPSAPSVGRQTASETLLIALIGGFSASSSKQANDEFSSDKATVGRVAVKHISQVTVALYILNARTGELLWSDQRVSQGGTIYKEKILNLADKIIDDLP